MKVEIIKLNVYFLSIINPKHHSKFRISLSTFLTDITVFRLLMHVETRVVFPLRVCVSVNIIRINMNYASQPEALSVFPCGASTKQVESSSCNWLQCTFKKYSHKTQQRQKYSKNGLMDAKMGHIKWKKDFETKISILCFKDFSEKCPPTKHLRTTIITITVIDQNEGGGINPRSHVVWNMSYLALM